MRGKWDEVTWQGLKRSRLEESYQEEVPGWKRSPTEGVIIMMEGIIREHDHSRMKEELKIELLDMEKGTRYAMNDIDIF